MAEGYGDPILYGNHVLKVASLFETDAMVVPSTAIVKLQFVEVPSLPAVNETVLLKEERFDKCETFIVKAGR